MSDSTFPDIHAETVLLFQDVKVLGAGEEARTCWDNGSTRALITHQYAQVNNFMSQPITFRLDVVASGKGVPHEGVIYIFNLVTNSGSLKKVWAFGVDEIMETPDPLDMAALRHLFPHLPESVFAPLTKKPVDLLIGNNFFHLHPDGGQGRDAVGDMKALHSQFGFGWIIAGSHPLLKPAPTPLSLSAHCIAKVNKCEISPHLSPSFWEGDNLGVEAPKKCNRCLSCSQCSDPALIHSRREQDELDELKKNTELKDDGIHVKYVFSKDPNCLPNNRATVVKMAIKQEQRLIKSGHLDYYNQEIKKYLERGAAVKLTEEELQTWKGPINYISHHGVERDSASTPLRIVTNSSLNNGGNSLNSCLIGGPNSLNPMLDIALRFRCYECGLVFDLTKAYNSLHTGLIEKNLRRFIWRFSQEEDWSDFAFDCVAFGDFPAANFLEIGRDITADAGVEIDPEATKKIKEDSYVDDCISGGSVDAVERMKGVKLADGSFSGSMTKILQIGKLKIKTIVSSGDTDEEAMALIGNKVLGYGWNASTDMMSVKFPIYLTNKKRKCRIDPPLTKESLIELLPKVKMTRRVCLGITNAFGDFLGMACPFTLRFKLLMKQLFEPGEGRLDWDKLVHGDGVDAWLQLIAEAVETDSLLFPRCTRPEKAIGSPTMVGFGDGAFPAFSGGSYIRWEYECQHLGEEECTGDYDSNLLWAKAKTTPLSGFTIPRSELSGTVLMIRVLKSSVKALQCDQSMKPKSVTPLVDSKCTISVLEKSVGALKPFFHNRVSEILENLADMRKVCEVEDLHYVASKDNPADLATRGGIKLEDIGPGSFWQKGPLFLCSRRDMWPVSRDFIDDIAIPEDEVRVKKTFFSHLRVTVLECCHMKAHPLAADQLNDAHNTPDLWAAVQRVLLYSNSIAKVKRILAWVIKGWKMKAASKTLTVDTIGETEANHLEQAEQLILLSAMPLTAAALYEEKLDSLCPQKEGHIITTTGRLGEKSLSRLLGVASLPILLPSSRASYLYMVRAHEGEHGTEHKSIVETLARSRQSVWIVRARQLAKKVCSNCFKCKREKKKLAGQRMALLKEESLTVCRPWTYVCLDFSGPIKVKGAVNARAKMKSWIIVYVCKSTKAVCLLATCGYSTEHFLLRHEEFVARHGAPAQIVSDRGSQLVSAGRILAVKESLAEKQSPDQWNWKQITSSNATTTWKFVPIGSQHFNGLPEATVKVLKRSLTHALHPGAELSFPELITLLSKISYSVNSRPLGLSSISNTSQQEDIMLPITPNMLLIGRSSDVSPPMVYSADDKFCRRLAYVDQVEQDW